MHPTGIINDLAISNNGDSDKILATVAEAVYSFIEKTPNAWVFATGSTPARTRLYQIGIAKYYHQLTKEFDIFRQIEEDWELFEQGKNYLAFIAKKKISN